MSLSASRLGRPLRTIVVGAYGRMGRMACEALEEDPEFAVVARIGRGDDLAAAVEGTEPDAVLELSLPGSAGANALVALERAVPVVVGATGLSAEDVARIRAAAGEVGAMIVPNFAVGAVLMMRMAEIAARWMPDAEIVETHHERKADAPSGTALATADRIARARRRSPGLASSPLPARGEDGEGVPVHSVRLPGFVAEQAVVFGGPGESLTIRHAAIDRTCYAPGMKLALKRVRRLEGLEIGLDGALFESP